MPKLTDIKYLQLACEVSRRSRMNGNHPFGAILVDVDGNILLEAENSCETERDATGHAETNLMRMASKKYDREFLEDCTMYTTVEPCVMCSGALYWAGLNACVYGVSEVKLLSLTDNHSDNPTFNLDCRTVFAAGQREIEVRGPFPKIEEEIIAVHDGFWD